MGCLQSILAKVLSSDGGSGGGSGSSGTVQLAAAQEIGMGERGVGVKQARGSAGGFLVSGEGVALAGDSVEQDSSYWEVRIASAGKFSIGVCVTQSAEALANAATLADSKDGIYTFTGTAIEAEGGGAAQPGDSETAQASFSVGEWIGITVDFTTMPMLTFSRKGEPLDALSVSRVRGVTFPAVAVSDGAALEVVFDGRRLQGVPPRGSQPLVKAMSMI